MCVKLHKEKPNLTKNYNHCFGHLALVSMCRVHIRGMAFDEAGFSEIWTLRWQELLFICFKAMEKEQLSPPTDLKGDQLELPCSFSSIST